MVDQHEMEVEESLEKPQPTKISFGLAKKKDVKLVAVPKEIASVHVDSDEERELEAGERERKRRKLTHFEDGSYPKDSDEKKSKTVIPMVVENDWRVQKLLDLEKEGKLTDQDRAKLALLTEANPFKVSESGDPAVAIPLDNDDKVIEDADYSLVPIEEFGLAILRGCGWNDGEGIGKNPQIVKVQLPPQRPKGLGLGAVPAKPKKAGSSKDKGKDEELSNELKKDSLIKIVSGRLTGSYGKVESRDDDNNSLYVRLALGGTSVKVSLFAVEAVTKKEYEQDSKCLNKKDYDLEKERIEKKKEEIEASLRKKESKDYQKDKDRDYSKSSSSKKSSSYVDDSEVWVRPDLMVRFVDKDYKKGRLFGSKLRVVDVASRKDVSLEDDAGRMYYNLRQSWMETVIPRKEGDRVMVVRGKYSGSIAVMEEKDKRNCLIVARLLSSNKVVELDFDYVSQFDPKDDELYED
ncbi:unnamed protein product [Auanema sp. JU1783]|nr:unnamed protein product [Auanema sp. JU1783]